MYDPFESELQGSLKLSCKALLKLSYKAPELYGSLKLSYKAPSSSSLGEGACGFNADLWGN